MTRPLSLLTLLLATPALAQDGACSSRTEYNGSTTIVSEAVDMGGGIVAQSTSFAADDGSGVFFVQVDTSFEFCATGRAISSGGYDLPSPDTPTSEVAAVILAAIASPERVSLDDIAGRINASTSSSVSVSEAPTTESCGCAEYYPDLRSSRIPYGSATADQ